ncbi:MAG TPA: ABC transporter substrate-binding protein, partial [Chloroflexota bacterium]|nr:ABC transporter substrate-binding protein [Chloroflexota bacterium]
MGLLALAAVVLVALFTGCGSGSGSPPASGELAIGIPTSINSLNPVTGVGPADTNFMHFVWAGLLTTNSAGKLMPVLAQQVPSSANGLVSSGGRAVTFVLKPGLRWSDGSPLTSADVRFGWQVAARPEVMLCPAVCWTVRSVTTEGPSRVTFHLTRPYSPLLFDLPPVLPRHQLWKGDWTGTLEYLFRTTTNFLSPRFAVDGPFMASSANKTGVSLVRNPHWTVLGRPTYPRVVLRSYKTDQAMLAATESGSVQISQGYSLSDLSTSMFAGVNGNGAELHLFPDAGVEHLEPNLGLQPTNDVRVRQALSLAIDRASLIARSLKLSLARAKGLVWFSPEFPGRFDGVAAHGAWNPLLGHFSPSRDIAAARRLLAIAGWHLRSDGYRYRHGCPGANGCRLTVRLFVPSRDTLRRAEGLALKEMWKSIGVNTVIVDTWSIQSMISTFQENGACSRGYDTLCLMAQNPGYDPQTDFGLEFTSNHIARWKRYPHVTD